MRQVGTTMRWGYLGTRQNTCERLMSTGVDVNRQVTVTGREVNQSGKVALASISAHAVITGSALKVYKFSAGRARKVNLHPLRRIFPAANLWQQGRIRWTKTRELSSSNFQSQWLGSQ